MSFLSTTCRIAQKEKDFNDLHKQLSPELKKTDPTSILFFYELNVEYGNILKRMKALRDEIGKFNVLYN